VDALRPASTLEDATGELVDDLHLAALDDVVLVALVQLLGLERHLELVDEVGRHVVVEVLDVERPLDPLDALLERHDDPLVLFDLVVDVTLQRADDRGEAVVQLGRVTHAARDDERRARLVDEDRVDLVHDAVVVAPLDLVLELRRHVVAQVVEAHLVVGAVGDVGAVIASLLGRRRLETGDDEADAQAEPLVDATHPLGVAACEVVVHRHEVHTVAGQAVQVGGQRRDQGLALAGLHLGDPPEVERRAAHHLDVVVALPDDPVGRLAGHRERLDEDVVEGLTVVEPLPEFGRLAPQLVVGEPPVLVLPRVDVGDDALQCLEFLAFPRAEDAIENAHASNKPTGGTAPAPAVGPAVTPPGAPGPPSNDGRRGRPWGAAVCGGADRRTAPPRPAWWRAPPAPRTVRRPGEGRRPPISASPRW
jgi:hypothetical protein